MEKNKNYEEKLNENISVYYDEKSDANKNKDFAQINIKYQAELMQLAITEPLAMTLFMLFIARMEKNNTYIVTKQELAECVHKSTRSIDRAITALRESNFIVLMKYQRANVYFINPQVACSCSAYYKSQLIKEYLKLAEYPNKADKDIIDLSFIVDDKNRLILKTDFYKKHKELQKPKAEDIASEIGLLELLNSMPQEELLELKKRYAKGAITEEERKQIAESIQKNQELTELLRKEREQQEELHREKELQHIEEMRMLNKDDVFPNNQTNDYVVPPVGYRPTDDNPFGL